MLECLEISIYFCLLFCVYTHTLGYWANDSLFTILFTISVFTRILFVIVAIRNNIDLIQFSFRTKTILILPACLTLFASLPYYCHQSHCSFWFSSQPLFKYSKQLEMKIKSIAITQRTVRQPFMDIWLEQSVVAQDLGLKKDWIVPYWSNLVVSFNCLSPFFSLFRSHYFDFICLFASLMYYCAL